MKTKVACVFVEGHVPFTVEYVVRLKSMVETYLAREHEFVVLTDRPQLFETENMRVVEIPKLVRGVFGWWGKLHLFNPAIEVLQSGRCMYLDLDSIVIGQLDSVFDYMDNDRTPRIALVPDAAPNFTGKGDRRAVKRYNSSIMVWEGGELNHLFNNFKLEDTLRLWGDQDWIGEQLVDAQMFPLEWFPRLSQCLAHPPMNARVVLCKKPKNLEAARLIPWVREAWQ
jgi:hypothetical protein